MKVALHGLVGGIMSSVSGSGFTSGALGAGANEAIQKKLMNIKDADLHQWASAIIGATATNILGGNVKAGASAAASGTKNNLEAHDIAKQNNEYFWVADNGKHYQFLPGVIQPGTIVKVVDYDGTEHYIIAEDPDFGGNDNYVSEPGYWQSARSMYLRPWTFDSQVSNLVYGGDELKPAYVKAFEIGYNYVDNGVQIVTDATIDGIKVVSDGATKVVDAVGNYGDNITKQSFSEANQQLGNDLIKAADETKAGLTDVTNTAIEKTVSNTNEANIKLQEEVINPIVNDVKTITNEVKDSSYKFYKYEIIPVGQGFTSSIVQNMSYNTVPLEMNNGDNTKMYYIGKTLGDVVCTVGGGVVTLGEAGMTVVASPTGVGVLAGSAATAYTAGATLNSAHNMSNDFNRIFSSKGANGGTEVVEGPSKAGTLSNVEARKWYLQQEAKIAGQIDKSLSLEQQAKQAFELRNQYRTEARKLMADRKLAEQLNVSDPNRTWEEIVKKTKDKGLSGDDVWSEIIESSMRSRQSVNKSLGLE